MGNDNSKTQGSCRMFDNLKKWIKDEHGQLIQQIDEFKSSHTSVETTNIALIGPVQAGKTSFLNTVASIDKERLSQVCSVGSGEKGVTTMLQTLQTTQKLKGIKIYDTMGMQDRDGINYKDITALIKGNLPPKFEFNPTKAASEDTPGYKKKPTFQDRMHVVVFVIDINVIVKSSVNDPLLRMVKEIIDEILRNGIPTFVLLTKVDTLLHEVNEDVTRTDTSVAVKEAMNKAQELFKIPEKHVFPIQNCVDDETADFKEILTLRALRQMLNSTNEVLGPWQTFDNLNKWSQDEHQKLIKEVTRIKTTAFKLTQPLLEKINIALIGPVEAGKTSFLHTVSIIDEGQVPQDSSSGSVEKGAMTNRQSLQAKKILKGINIYETMAMSKSRSNPKDITALVKGNLPPNFKFNQETDAIEEYEGYNKNPSFEDRMHVVVFVIDINDIGQDSKNDSSPGKMKQIMEEIQQHGIPTFVILTKVDKILPEVKEDVTRTDKSFAVQDAVNKAQELFKIPAKHIFPVQNYASDLVETDFEKEILILLALRQMLHSSIVPWRTFEKLKKWSEDEHKELIREITELKSSQPVKKATNLALIGPDGVGKTSFLKTVSSIDKGLYVSSYWSCICGEGVIKRTMPDSIITQKCLNGFNIYKTMVMHEQDGNSPKAITALIKGNLPANYVFNQKTDAIEEFHGFIKNPSFEDRMHAVVFVIDMNDIRQDSKNDSSQRKMKTIIEEILKLGIPTFVILTKVDKMLPEVKEDVTRTYKAFAVQDAVNKAQKLFKIPEKHIFPVQNYTDDKAPDLKKEILTLLALRQMLYSTIEPWRTFENLNKWSKDEHQTLIREVTDFITEFNLSNRSLENTNIELIGPVQAGKTSFLNTVSFIDEGRELQASSVGSGEKRVTIMLETKQNLKGIKIYDAQGLIEQDKNNQKDITALIKENHPSKLNPNETESEETQGNKMNHTFQDRMHMVVFVIDINDIGPGRVNDSLQRTIKGIMDERLTHGIPTFVLLTKVDTKISEVKEDVTRTYKSVAVQDAVKQTQKLFKIPEEHVFPVQNCTDDTTFDFQKEILTLLALRQMLHSISGPWRTFHNLNKWSKDEHNELIRQIAAFKSSNPSLRTTNIGLFGPAGAGKKSFLNTVSFIDAGGTGEKRLTTMIKLMTAGSEETKDYKKKPTFEDRMHVVVFVIDINDIGIDSANESLQMKEFNKERLQHGIPAFVLLTKVDTMLPEVKEDVTRTYKSFAVQDAVNKAQALLRIPGTHVFPVQNYADDTDDTPFDFRKEILTLLALRQMLYSTNDAYILTPNKSMATQEFEKAMIAEMHKRRISLQSIDNDRKGDISHYVPLLLVCNNSRRMDADVELCLEKLNNASLRHTVLIVLHVSSNENLGKTSSKSVKAKPLFKTYPIVGEVIDFAYEIGQGIYSCSMNESAWKALDKALHTGVRD